MLTKEQIKDGVEYNWETSFHVDFDMIIRNLIENELDDNIEVIREDFGECIVLVDGERFLLDLSPVEIFCHYSVRIHKLPSEKEEEMNPKDIDWEQRRYEIAKAIVLAEIAHSNTIVGEPNIEGQVRFAVNFANKLVKALKEKED